MKKTIKTVKKNKTVFTHKQADQHATEMLVALQNLIELHKKTNYFLKKMVIG